MNRSNKLSLTRRELEILTHIARGRENAEIAKVEFISVETVRTHVRHILEKLRARNRAHAVSIAFRTGVFTVPETRSQEATISRPAPDRSSRRRPR